MRRIAVFSIGLVAGLGCGLALTSAGIGYDGEQRSPALAAIPPASADPTEISDQRQASSPGPERSMASRVPARETQLQGPPASTSVERPWVDWRAMLPAWLGDARQADLAAGRLMELHLALADLEIPAVEPANAQPSPTDTSGVRPSESEVAAHEPLARQLAVETRRPWSNERFQFAGWCADFVNNGIWPVTVPDLVGADHQAPASPEASLDWYQRAVGAVGRAGGREEALAVLQAFETRRRRCVVRILDRIVDLAATKDIGRGSDARAAVLIERRLVVLRDDAPERLQGAIREYLDAWPALLGKLRAEMGVPAASEQERLVRELLEAAASGKNQ